MTSTPIVVIDVETTGLDPAVDHIWEIGAIRIDDGQITDAWSVLVEHHEHLAAGLPARYRAQHDEVCAAGELVPINTVCALLEDTFAPAPDGTLPTLVGAIPWFDAAFLRKITGRDLWNYRLRCVESMTAGHLGRDVGGLSDCLAALDLEPIHEAHRALGDAHAAARIWNHLVVAQ